MGVEESSVASGITFQQARMRARGFWGAAAFAVGALLYSVHLRSDLYGDEWGHTHKVIMSPHFLRTLSDPSMCHPPLYFALAKLSYHLTGQLWAIRLPSVVCALGAVLFLGKAAKETLGKGYEVPALWLASFSPFVLEFAAEGRAYAMLMFFSVGALWAYARFLDHESRATTAAVVGFCVGGALTHYFFQFQLVALAVHYLVTKRRITWYSLTAAFVVGATTAGLFLLTFILQSAKFREALQVDWVKTYFSAPNFLARLPIATLFGYSTFELDYLDPARNVPLRLVYDNALLLLPAALALLGLAAAWAWLLWRREKPTGLLTAAIAIPVFLGLAASLSGFYLIREKHLAVIWAPALLLTLKALSLLRGWRPGWIVTGCYVVVCGVSIGHFVFKPNEYSRREDWTGLRRELEALVKEQDIVMAYSQWTLRRPEFGGTIAPPHVRKIDLTADCPSGVSLQDFVRGVLASAPGRVFFICYGTDRHGADPAGVALSAMFGNTRVAGRHFGRGLSLYLRDKAASDG